MLVSVTAGQCRSGSRLYDLPNEILDGILGHVLGVPFERFDHPLPSPFNGSEFKRSPPSRVLEVCSLFRDAGCRHLYGTVVLRSQSQAQALVKTLQENSEGRTKTSSKGLYLMVKMLRVENALEPPISEVLRLCQNITHLWVNVWGVHGMGTNLQSMKLAHITIWDVQMVKASTLEEPTRGGFVAELCEMIRCSRTLKSLKYHRPLKPDVHSTQILSGILASSSLKTVTLPSRPLKSGPDRDLSLFGLFLKMKSLAHLNIQADDHTKKDFCDGMPDFQPRLLEKLSVLFEPSDLDSYSRSFSFDLNRFDLAYKMAFHGRIPQFTVDQLLINWHTGGHETSQFINEWRALAIVDLRPRLSANDRKHSMASKADYRAFSYFLREHLGALTELTWETNWDPFIEGTADTVARGLEERLPLLEILGYQSSERHFLDTLSTMSLPRLTELRLTGGSREQAGIELFLQAHGHKLTKIQIDLGTHIKGLFTEFCPQLEELILRVTGKDYVDLQNFSEVVSHKKLKRMQVLHEGGSDAQVMRQLRFITMVNWEHFTAFTDIKIRCRWPSTSTRWNRENNFFVRLAQACWDRWGIKVSDETGKAWVPLGSGRVKEV